MINLYGLTCDRTHESMFSMTVHFSNATKLKQMSVMSQRPAIENLQRNKA